MKFQSFLFIGPADSQSTDRLFLKTIERCYRVNRREIAFLKFIFEACDGIAMVKTLDEEAGIIVLHIPPGCERDVETILQDLKGDMLIEPAGV